MPIPEMNLRGRLIALCLAPPVLASVLASGANADIVTLGELQHGTLYESTGGEQANGLGQYFFAGNNNQGRARRGLLAFDLAPLENLNIQINSVTLRLYCSQENSGLQDISVHRVTSDWGVGSSDAPGNEGGGTAATPDSATWNYAFFDSVAWNNAGGDFVSAASATTTVDAVGWYEWSDNGLAADLEAWLAGNDGAFGWEFLGDETSNGTTKRFDSGLGPNGDRHPELIVDYTVIPTPASCIALLGLACRSRRRR
ncbi:MAG: hypothetical protein MK085_07675 [Phycisphaerales bacterium]|nr:hypothetical protein [Phycisphaerales bacterium]